MVEVVHHPVPHVRQVKDMSCWYAAACMVNYYYEVGPRLGLPQVWIDDTGVDEHQVRKLAEVEGLRFLKPSSVPFTEESLMTTLRRSGPIWAAGYYFGRRHVIVVTGAASDGVITYLDPDEEMEQSDDVVWLNESVLKDLLLVKDFDEKGKARTPMWKL